MNFFKVLGCYIRQHMKGILLFILFGCVFGIVFFLADLPVMTVLYAVFLCVCIAVIVMSIDFIAYLARHRKMERLTRHHFESPDELDPPRNLTERDYFALLENVHQQKMRMISDYDTAKQDMTDYYTLWAHQIKTPIAAMRLLLQSEDTPENSELSAELFKIEQYALMVLSYLRLDSDTNDFVIGTYRLDDIVKQAVRKYAPLFIRGKITLNLKNLETDVVTDEKWLVFVVEQILSNAIKYTKTGSISVYTDENSVLVIEDTGIGIAADDLPRLCEKGFTGYNGRADKKSTGLGLYLCRRILSRLNHTISFESKTGVGTKVLINLTRM